jgi:pimeloyl-ACP methyl ester carboxylesterase
VPRTAIQIARELAELIEVARVSGPLILVGHSMGGRHVLRFAELRPFDVLAVVLLDTPPPGFERGRMELLTPEEQEERRRILEQGVHGAPEVVRLEREGAAQDDEIPFGAFPRDLPLFVVAANRQDFGTLGSPDAHRDLWVEMSRKWLDLSDASRLVLADGSRHMIHHDRPALVIRLVRELIEASQ